jgi:hypothetical protein
MKYSKDKKKNENGPVTYETHFIFSSSATLPLIDSGECAGKKNQTQRRTDKKQKKELSARRKEKEEKRKQRIYITIMVVGHDTLQFRCKILSRKYNKNNEKRKLT